MAERRVAKAGVSGVRWLRVRYSFSAHTEGHAAPPPVRTHETQQKGQPPSDGGVKKDASLGHCSVLHVSDTPVVSPRITPPLLRPRAPQCHIEPGPGPLRLESSVAIVGLLETLPALERHREPKSPTCASLPAPTGGEIGAVVSVGGTPANRAGLWPPLGRLMNRWIRTTADKNRVIACLKNRRPRAAADLGATRRGPVTTLCLPRSK